MKKLIQIMIVVLAFVLLSTSMVSAISATAPVFDYSTSNYNVSKTGQEVGNNYTVVNLATVTSDPNADPLNFSITAQSSADILCALAADNATVECALAQRVDTAFSTITVSVTDGTESAFDDINISFVNNNISQAPYFIIPMSVFNTTRTGSNLNTPIVIISDLDSVTDDADNDSLTYAIVSQTNTDISCSIIGVALNCSLVTATANAFSTITIELDDGFGKQTTGSFNVSLQDNNLAPEFVVPTNLFNTTRTNASFGDMYVILNNVSSVVSDPNGDNVIVSVVGQTDSSIDCSIIGVALNCTYVGPALSAFSTVTLELNDTKGGVTLGSFNVSITNANLPPTFVVPTVLFNTTRTNASFGTEYVIISNVSSVVSDPNGDNVIVSVVGQTDSSIDCSIIGVALNCTYVGPAWNAFSTVTLQLNDGRDGGIVNGSFNVSIANANQPPIFIVPTFVFNTTRSNVSFGDEFVVINNVSTVVSDPNGDAVTVSVVGQTDSNIDCSFTDVALNCSLVGSAVNAFSTVTLQLNDGNGALVNGSFNVSFMNNDVLAITNITSNPNTTVAIRTGNTIDVSFDSTKYPLNVTLELRDGSSIISSVTVLVTSASGLPVRFTTPTTSTTDGTYDLFIIAQFGAEVVEESVGSFTFDFTAPSTGGGRGRTTGGSSFGGTTPIVIIDSINEPASQNETEDTTNSSNTESEIIVVNEPEGALLSSEEIDGNGVSGQFTGGDGSSNFNWIWWVVALIIIGAIIWFFAAKSKKPAKSVKAKK